ncbi:MAG: 8-amino-7-oxononanoate synthase, partial [Bacteroidota bacterium]
FKPEVKTDCKPYHKFFTQPNMVFNIPPDWNTFEDYLSCLKSKYRVRYKRALKKGADIQSREFKLIDIEQYENEMFQLFKQVANNADFSTFNLNDHYFKQLKIELKDNIYVKGYFLGDKLVGFTTLINNGHELEAHYLGYDAPTNTSTQLYLNMLYDMVKYGIEQNFSKLVFSRTAMEIKSSVGAKPENMYFYLRHQSSQKNKMVPLVLSYLTPNQEWKERNPFKD